MFAFALAFALVLLALAVTSTLGQPAPQSERKRSSARRHNQIRIASVASCSLEGRLLLSNTPTLVSGPVSALNSAAVDQSLSALAQGHNVSSTLAADVAQQTSNSSSAPIQSAFPVVTSSADSGPGTLRAAVDAVDNGGDPTGLVYVDIKEIRLTSDLTITQPIELEGQGETGSNGSATISGNGHKIILQQGGSLVNLNFNNTPVVDDQQQPGELQTLNDSFSGVQPADGVTAALSVIGDTSGAAIYLNFDRDVFTNNGVTSLAITDPSAAQFSATLNNMSFTKNTASALSISAYGGFYIGNMTVTNSTSQQDMVSLSAPGSAEDENIQAAFTGFVAVKDTAPTIFSVNLPTTILDAPPPVPVYFRSSVSLNESLIADNTGVGVSLASGDATTPQVTSIETSTIEDNTGGDLINKSTLMALSSTAVGTITLQTPVNFSDGHNWLENLQDQSLQGGKGGNGLKSTDTIGKKADFAPIIFNPNTSPSAYPPALLLLEKGSPLSNNGAGYEWSKNDISGITRTKQNNNIGSSTQVWSGNGVNYFAPPKSGNGGGSTGHTGGGSHGGSGNSGGSGSGTPSQPASGTYVLNTGSQSQLHQLNARVTVSWAGGHSTSTMPVFAVTRRNPFLNHNGDLPASSIVTTSSAELLSASTQLQVPAGAKILFNNSSAAQYGSQKQITVKSTPTFVINIGQHAAVRHANAGLNIALAGGNLYKVLPAIEVGYSHPSSSHPGTASGAMQQAVYFTSTPQEVISPAAIYEMPAGSKVVLKYHSGDAAQVSRVMRTFRGMRRAA